jgi:hypothetical protein
VGSVYSYCTSEYFARVPWGAKKINERFKLLDRTDASDPFLFSSLFRQERKIRGYILAIVSMETIYVGYCMPAGIGFLKNIVFVWWSRASLGWVRCYPLPNTI